MPFSLMQKQYIREANHRWNIKSGATRSGKTYMDYYLIPMRIREVSGQDGLVAILGNTRGTLQRNIIEPLQNLWGTEFVSSIRSDNTAMLFGERCYCLGADKVTQVDRLRGSSLKYCYGDEVVTWNPEVFDMLKSRLDKPYSKFDGTCNPEGKQHWFKQFLDDGEKGKADIYCQKYTIDDNPYLDPDFVRNLKSEYDGTIYYDRYILGLWTNAEGLIYTTFANKKDEFIVDDLSQFDFVFATIGVDFGGGTSAHAFNCTAFTRGLNQMVTINDYRRKDATTPERLYADFGVFLDTCRQIIPNIPIVDVYCDSAEQTLIGGMRVESAKNGWRINIHNARKNPINDRIRFYTVMQGAGRYRIHKRCSATIEAFETAMWMNNPTADIRLDDGTTNIDNLDAQEYSTETYMRDMMNRKVK